MTSTIDMVDRFSSLPNELLNLIFDQIYTSNPPSAPISKRFLPFHRIHLYHTVRLSRPSQLDPFLRAIEAQPALGNVVNSLTLSTQPYTKKFTHSTGSLTKLICLLPRLKELDARGLYDYELLHHSVGLLWPIGKGLECLALPAPDLTDDSMVNLGFYNLLEECRTLTEFRLYEWDIYDPETMDVDVTSNFPHIKTLEIHGEGAEDASVDKLLEMFPSLQNLTLHSTYSDVTSWRAALSVIPNTLDCLTLLADSHHFSPADNELHSLVSLTRIHLGQHCYSPSIHLTLQRLKLLKEIHLGSGALNAIGFLSLVTGPSRLLYLEHLILDLDEGSYGPCTTLSGDEVSLESNEDGTTDWKLPHHFDGGELKRGDVACLIEVARSSGIRVEGTILKALKVLKLYCIDSNNRAILAYSGPEDLRRLHKIRMEALRHDYRVPEFDSDSLERDKLEIVEMRLEESNWSVFGFKEK